MWARCGDGWRCSRPIWLWASAYVLELASDRMRKVILMTAGRTVIGLSRDWGTPEKYVAAVRQVFGGQIDLDPCSNKFSIVSAKVEYLLPTQDGLKESWRFQRIYVNPPYGSDAERGTRIRDWLARCAEAHEGFGSEVLALVPVATNTGHWKKYVWGAATAIAFLHDTRLKFLVNGRSTGKGAPMSCAMVYWGTGLVRFRQAFSEYGAVVDVRDVHSQMRKAHRQLALVR